MSEQVDFSNLIKILMAGVLLGTGVLGGGQLDLTGARNWRDGLQQELDDSKACKLRVEILEGQVNLLIEMVQSEHNVAGELQIPNSAWDVVQ